MTDNRRLTLWVAFGLVLLGGIGLDRLSAVRPGTGWKVWGWVWVAGSLTLLAGSGTVDRLAPSIRARAAERYQKAFETTPGADLEVYRARAERQARETLDFVPRYLGLAAVQGLVLAWLLRSIRLGRLSDDRGRAALLGLTMVDLFGFGFGLNPTIDRVDDRPTTSVIQSLRSEIGSSGRIIGLGAELPPNTLMRYGLADARNYDSVELSRSLAWFEPLYDPSVGEHTSRREMSWERVVQARGRLFQAGVRAIVAPTRPPDGLGRVEQIGRVWVAWLDAARLIQLEGDQGSLKILVDEPGRIVVEVDTRIETRLIVRQTFDPGWRAEVDGRAVRTESYLDTFLAVPYPLGSHRIALEYDPIEVRIGSATSVIAFFLAVFTLTGFAPFRSTRIMVGRLGRTQAIGLESDS